MTKIGKKNFDTSVITGSQAQSVPLLEKPEFHSHLNAITKGARVNATMVDMEDQKNRSLMEALLNRGVHQEEDSVGS